jgi:hypothetical protein
VSRARYIGRALRFEWEDPDFLNMHTLNISTMDPEGNITDGIRAPMDHRADYRRREPLHALVLRLHVWKMALPTPYDPPELIGL